MYVKVWPHHKVDSYNLWRDHKLSIDWERSHVRWKTKTNKKTTKTNPQKFCLSGNFDTHKCQAAAAKYYSETSFKRGLIWYNKLLWSQGNFCWSQLLIMSSLFYPDIVRNLIITRQFSWSQCPRKRRFHCPKMKRWINYFLPPCILPYGNDSVNLPQNVYRSWLIITCFITILYNMRRLRVLYIQGRIQDFNLGGGGAKDYVRARTSRARSLKSLIILRPGSRARFRALEALRVIDALSCYLSLIFKHSDTKCRSTFFFGGGGGACCGPL